MMWTEIDLDHHVAAPDLKQALGKTFGIPATRIEVVSDFAAEVESIDPQTSIVVEHYTQPGDFPERLMIVLWEATLKERVGDRESSVASIAMLATLASALDASIIAADDDPDPYTGILIEPSGEVFRIGFDPDTLDDNLGVVIDPGQKRVRIPGLSHLVAS
jgi:hypothetical protein